MLLRPLHHIRRNAIAYCALISSVTGTAYAAVSLPPGSVGTRQLRNHSITPVKLKQRNGIGGYVPAWAKVSAGGHVLAGSPGASASLSGSATGPGGPNFYSVQWRGVRLPRRCGALVTLAGRAVPSALSAQAGVTVGGRSSGVVVSVYDAQDHGAQVPFTVAVLC